MRIRRISIDGYGRFTGLDLEFHPGLQVIIGPNEQGKSTIRAFIGDMLYGQKSSTMRRIYDESNELRIPWNNPDCYGGTLLYQLDRGNEIEVVRNFDRERESVQIYDRTHAREITSEFQRLRNREIDFASVHLGLGREVFLNTATIGHFSLEELGDEAALGQIKEKLLSLADTGGESESADAALRRLAERIASIGQPNARSKPLPKAREALDALEREYQAALGVHRELERTGETRRALLDKIEALRERKLGLEEDLRLLEAHERARRLSEAEELHQRIDLLTKESFALSSVREFPLDMSPDIQRAENRLNTARVQIERTRDERDSLAAQLAAERQSPGDDQAALPDLPDDLETPLNDASARVQTLGERAKEIEDRLREAEAGLESSQHELEILPDFSRIATDPVEYLTTLASSFAMAVKSRNEECEERTRLRNEIDQRRAAIAGLQALFGRCLDFPEQAREYELGKRMREEQLDQRSNLLHSLNTTREEVSDRLPGLLWLTAFCGVFLAGLGITVWLTENSAILIAGGLVLLAMVYFLGSYTFSRARLMQIARQIAETQNLLEELRNQNPDESLVAQLMQKAGCHTTRELEALYDQYREASAELAARLEVREEQESRAAEAEERIPQLLEHLRETFRRAGETIADEQDVKRATSGAIARYQEYRETKRRITDGILGRDRWRTEIKKIHQERENAAAGRDAAEAALRELLRKNGFEEEAQYETALAALRAFRAIASAQRERHGRLKVLEDRAEALERRYRSEEADIEKAQHDLGLLLRKAGVDSVERFHESVEQARAYRELREKRAALEEQLEALLRGQDLRELRRMVEEQGPLPPATPGATVPSLRAELEAIQAEIEQRRVEEHQLHLNMTERGAGTRAINEIEEERARIERSVQALDLELTATSHAMTQIEDVARDKYARIAPRLAEGASRYIAAITDGAYTELRLSRELTIGVRIPQTRRMNESPERVLSKGTVDQIYLALRLALVEAVSENNETVPMLLDDPFANYDDQRLDRTLRLLATIGERQQVLLFTCREDVARAAEAIQAPIIRL